MKRLSTTALALSATLTCLLPAGVFAQKASIRSFGSSLSKPSSTKSFRSPVISRRSSFQLGGSQSRSTASKPGTFSSSRAIPRISRPITVAPRTSSVTNRTPNLRVTPPNVSTPRITNPNVSTPRITNPNVLNPRRPPTSSRVPDLRIRPTIPPRVDFGRVNPGNGKPDGSQPRITIPNKPLPTLRDNLRIRNIKPDQSRLSGLRKFDSLVGKLDLAKDFKPVQPDKFKESLKHLKHAQIEELKSPLGTKTKTAALRHLGLNPLCHWWVDFCIGWHWHHHHCHWWDICYTPGYWNCWTPCRYNIIYCPPRAGYVACSWYFGVECVLIPDMGCYGIQSVTPNSPAALAGLQPGDMINSINGFGIAEEGMLQREIQRSGGLLRLGILRNGAVDPVAVDVVLRRVRTLSY